METEISCMI